jgi:4-hydroxybenzoyl-CoA reductase subunit beta
MSLPEFKLLRPRTVEEAVEMLGKHSSPLTLAEPNTKLARGGVQICAGGTDLLPSMRQKLFEPEYLLDLRGVSELRGIRVQEDGSVTIGALTTLSAIEDSTLIAERYPVLREAARTVASPLLRNMGTIGGNICLDTRCLWYNQSAAWRTSCGFCIKKDGDLCHVAPGGKACWAAFSGDTPPALLCLEAEVEIASPHPSPKEGERVGHPGERLGHPTQDRAQSGVRRVPISELYTSVGDARLKIAKNEILTQVILPAKSAGWRGAYLKLRMRGSIDYPLAGVAVAVKANGKIEAARVALTAVNPAPVLVKRVEEALVGKAVSEVTDNVIAEIGELAARTAKPLTTSALTPEYRREIVRVYARRALMAALRS